MKTEYHQLLHRLFNINRFGGMKLGLQNCILIDQFLNHPHRLYKTIQIAGTNGKGSVTKKIATALEAAGYKVGQYTSPHISSFRERISINGQKISEEEIIALLDKLFSLIEIHKIPATFFEITTMMALDYFGERQVDFAVLETGLGGRLDATNIVSPQLSVITSISLDHTEILGTTIEEIALEKAGIIKPNIPVLIGPKVPHHLIQQIADEKNAPCYHIDGTFATFDQENQAIAQKALEILDELGVITISKAAIIAGLNAQMPCRFETYVLDAQSDLQVILDVAHNPDGLLHLFETLKINYPETRYRILFGISATKDITQCLKIIAEHANALHPVEAPNGRGVSAKELQNQLISLGVQSERIDYSSEDATATEQLKNSLLRAIDLAKANKELLVICGTFFIMGEVREILGFNEPRDSVDMNERNLLGNKD